MGASKKSSQIKENEYTVDLVLCIDGTKSMLPMISNVKLFSKNFYSFYRMRMEAADMIVPNAGLRVKVIVFRDFLDKWNKPFEMSPWYEVYDPKKGSLFSGFIEKITPNGGLDNQENALEAIASAIKTDWNQNGGDHRRQVILVFTDNDTLNLQNPDRTKNNRAYPKGMPKNVQDLQRIWINGDQEFAPDYDPRAGRLVVFAPLTQAENEEDEDQEENRRIVKWTEWFGIPRVVLVPVKKDGGCSDINMEIVMDVLVSSYEQD